MCTVYIFFGVGGHPYVDPYIYMYTTYIHQYPFLLILLLPSPQSALSWSLFSAKRRSSALSATQGEDQRGILDDSEIILPAPKTVVSKRCFNTPGVSKRCLFLMDLS